MEYKKNNYPGTCPQCGGTVGAGEGWITRRQLADGSFGWGKPEHDTCPERADAPERDVTPLWWQYVGACRTVGGLQAPRGAVRRTGALPDDAVDWVPANEAAAMIASDIAAKPTTAVGERWLAYLRLRGLMLRADGETLDDLDALLGDVDLAEMDATVEAERQRMVAR